MKSAILRNAKCMKNNTSRFSTTILPSTSSSKGRWAYTTEILVSKIFPAGFGWQGASCIADANLGFAADSVQFALSTGLGDATGVIVGHQLYHLVKSKVSDRPVDMEAELKTATWLATGALCAGSAWQPAVNLFAGSMGLGFTSTFLGVTAVCGTMFMGGLAAGRKMYSWMPDATSKNIKQDIGLCISIGGATGMFVATDPSFIANADLLYSATAPLFNITSEMSTLQGCAIAGSSTMTGFALFNGAQNVLLPAGQNWMDNNNPYSTPAEEEWLEEEEELRHA